MVLNEHCNSMVEDKFIKSLLIFCLMIVTIFSGCIDSKKAYEETRKSSLEYRVSINPSETIGDIDVPKETIYDVRILLPYPVLDGNAIEFEAVSKPDNWDIKVVETEFGKMLELKADQISPGVWPTLVKIQPGEEPPETGDITSVDRNEIVFSMQLEREIGTMDPIGTEYLLNPKYNISEIPCNPEDAEHFKNINCKNYGTKIFVSYNSSGNASLSINAWFTGQNMWFSGGWRLNKFNDYISPVYLNGNQENWVNATGNLVTGQGIYLS